MSIKSFPSKSLIASAVTLALFSYQSVANAVLVDDKVYWDSSSVPLITTKVYEFGAIEASNSKDPNETGVIMLRVKDSASGSLSDFDIQVNALGKNSVSGDAQVVAVQIDGGNVEFSGDKLNLGINTDFYGTGGNQATAMLIYGGETDISADKVNLNVVSQNPSGKSIYGITSFGKLNVTSSEVNINLVNSTERTTANQYSETIGIDLASNEAIFSENTAVNIHVQTTSGAASVVNTGDLYNGSINGASPAFGIKFEGGSGNFKGNVNVTVEAVGGLASAVAVNNYFVNSSMGENYGDSAANFNNLNASAYSKTGTASGIAVSYVKGDENEVILVVDGTSNVSASTDSGVATAVTVSGKTSAEFTGNLIASATAGAEGEAYSVTVDEATLTIGGANNKLTGDVLVSNAADLTFTSGGNTQIQGNVLVTQNANLTLDNATLQLGVDNTISAQNLTSNQGTIVIGSVNEDVPTVAIQNLSGDALNVVASSDLGNKFSSVTEAAKSLENAVSIENSETDGTTVNLSGEESDVLGAWSVDKDGKVIAKENTKLASMKGLNAATLVAWRDEVAYTNQRMEFLRDNSHAYGAWAQVYGGESKYEDKAELTTTTVQVGADMAVGDWVAGAAFSYMTGEADMLRGDADTDAYTLSLYAERNFDSGLFVNGLARYGRLSTDATAGNMDASYDNNAFSLGGNVGYRFTFAEQAFVEPNFGLQYAYVMGDDYKASNGVKVEQDDFDALIASLGARVGFNFPNNAGKLFARASVNHDFLGEIDGTAGNGKAVQDMYVDLGGTWVTYGVGTQFNITDNLSVWGNVDRTTGGEVSTNYMMNAGLRYVF